METIFKVGDRVFDIEFGWGTVVKIENEFESPVIVDFDRYEDISLCYKFDGRYSSNSALKRLSFTEYTLQGFSQEKPINYEEYVGKWGVFWDKWWDGYYISKLKGIYINNGFTEFIDSASGKWDKFKPLTDEQIKILKSCD